MKCWYYNKQSCQNLNVQMVLLHLASWTSRWHHLVRGVGYHEPWWFSLTSWASFHGISTSVVYAVFKWEQSSCEYLLSHVNSLWISFDRCSTHPAITWIENTISEQQRLLLIFLLIPWCERIWFRYTKKLKIKKVIKLSEKVDWQL